MAASMQSKAEMVAVRAVSAAAPLALRILAECPVSKARACDLILPHGTVNTPVFMPVGTQGTMKGITADQLQDLGCKICLGNTYHLGMRPGPELIEKANGLHKFMNWKRNLLTVSTEGESRKREWLKEMGSTTRESIMSGQKDSGGFQMVSLVQLSEVTEEGVRFQSPYDGKEILLSPEKSIAIQNSLGSDIMMQLDDVVSSTITGPRVEEAMKRSIRWLDRCIAANKNPDRQNLFAIIQGGLNAKLRKACLDEMTKRDVPGFAIGGLSGGEEKDDFWKMVTLSTDNLPRNKPRYLMGVGPVAQRSQEYSPGPCCLQIAGARSPGLRNDMASYERLSFTFACDTFCMVLQFFLHIWCTMQMRSMIWTGTTIQMALNDTGFDNTGIPKPNWQVQMQLARLYAVELVVCSALGCDMFDCVFPTRTALKKKQFAKDFQPIDPDCQCPTCKRSVDLLHSRAYLHALFKTDTAAMHHVTVHNISYQLTLMRSVRESIIEGRFPEFVRTFMKRMFPVEGTYPGWAVDALASVNITLDGACSGKGCDSALC
ncbi:hypothetical protein JZ751_027502 [Albula glossodonta]|uniref:WH2 domain-containing protein n=1 Tax=Albula glossodonta TaxID=121402 RepID=A0A8T2NFZ1_9TELE|nr:hypothetical protein JZ751_027502 [Albula glossodonta]